MKATGIVRKIDDLGRVVIPKELRRTFKIKEGDPLEIFVSEDGILIRPYKVGCEFCGEIEKEMAELSGIRVCYDCAKKLMSRVGEIKEIE